MNFLKLGSINLKNRGFTLIELLVVIAIIGILAAIMFPIFAQAREKGRQSTCLSNLKQLGLAAIMYADDYDGYFPPFGYKIDDSHYQYWYGLETGTWPGPFTYNLRAGLLDPYKNKSTGVLRCPSFHPDYPVYGDGLGYGYNCPGIGGNEYSAIPPANLSQLANPADTILFGDAGLHYDVMSSVWPPPIVSSTWESTMIVSPATLLSWGYPSMEYRFHDLRHNGRANMVFADGHAKAMMREALESSEDLWDRQ